MATLPPRPPWTWRSGAARLSMERALLIRSASMGILGSALGCLGNRRAVVVEKALEHGRAQRLDQLRIEAARCRAGALAGLRLAAERGNHQPFAARPRPQLARHVARAG